MKRLIFIFLFFPLILSGQGIMSGVVGSKGTVAAPAEMLTNGALTGGTSWTSLDANFALSGDAGVYNDAAFSYIRQTAAAMAINVVANKAYKLTFDITNATGAGCQIKFSTWNGSVDFAAYASYNNGSKTVTFTTPGNVDTGGFRVTGNTPGESGCTIDNISLKAN